MSEGTRGESTTGWDLDARVAALESRPEFHPGGPGETFAASGRLQLIALLRRGLTPQDHVIDVGCGGLRAGYWLIHFLDPGRYHGIEPMAETLEVGRAEILEPGLEDAKKPEFRSNDDFDLSGFGVAPGFVLARSIWSHTSKAQITALLASFAAVARPDALLLASYLPAERGAQVMRPRGLAARLLGRKRGSRGPTGPGRADYQGDVWAGYGPGTAELRRVMVAHRFDWIQAECERHGLVVAQARSDNFGGQKWLEVTRRH